MLDSESFLQYVLNPSVNKGLFHETLALEFISNEFNMDILLPSLFSTSESQDELCLWGSSLPPCSVHPRERDTGIYELILKKAI